MTKELLLPSGKPAPPSITTVMDRKLRTWKLSCSYISARAISREERESLAERIGEFQHQWKPAEATLDLHITIKSWEPMHLTLGSWLLDVQEAVALILEISANNLIRSRIERYLSPEEKRGLVKMNREHLKGKGKQR